MTYFVSILIAAVGGWLVTSSGMFDVMIGVVLVAAGLLGIAMAGDASRRHREISEQLTDLTKAKGRTNETN